MVQKKNDQSNSIISWHGLIFRQFDHLFNNLKHFFYVHENLFEILFLFIYLIEQFSLLYYFYFSNFNEEILVGFFTLLVLFTISFEKISLKMRKQKLSDDKKEIEKSFEIEKLNFYREYNELVELANKNIQNLTSKHNELSKEYNLLLNDSKIMKKK